jgi:anhydro-N-acetylmuramic acid kinase
MNNPIGRLYEVSLKKERLIIGLMSGTSLDGLDIALCRIRGSGLLTKIELLEFETIAYANDFVMDIRQIFSKKQVDLEKVCLLNALTGTLHAKLILNTLKKWNIDPKEIDCIASHGQTIYHAPKRMHQLADYPNATLQIGDGDHIAVKTGILTISDFRQKHLAAGGEGAPLALYGDYLIFTDKVENRILLNMGGISNFTFLPSGGDSSQIISTDVGPGNTLIDALSQKYFNEAFDEDGRIAKKGTVNESLLNVMLSHPFFNESLPKTCGPELFNLQFIEAAKTNAGIPDISAEDLIATVTQLTASAITQALKEYDNLKLSIYVSGGGSHNPMIMSRLKTLSNVSIKSTKDLGINPDAKEAILFAVLANETLSGSSPVIGNAPSVTMGKISFPV